MNRTNSRHQYPVAQPRAESAEPDSPHELQQRPELRQSIATPAPIRTSTKTPSGAASITSARSPAPSLQDRGSITNTPRRCRAPASPIRAPSASTPTPTIRKDSNNSYANALLGNYDSYSEPLAGRRRITISPTRNGFSRTIGKSRATCRSAGVSASITIRRSMTRSRSSRPSLPPRGIRRKLPVLIRPAVVNGQNVGIDPTTGTVYGLGQVGAFVPGVGNPADGMVIGGQERRSERIYQHCPDRLRSAFRIRLGSLQGRQNRHSRRRRHLLSTALKATRSCNYRQSARLSSRRPLITALSPASRHRPPARSWRLPGPCIPSLPPLTSSRFITTTSASTGASDRISFPPAIPDRWAAICSISATSIPCAPGARFPQHQSAEQESAEHQRAVHQFPACLTRPTATSTCANSRRIPTTTLCCFNSAPPVAWHQCGRQLHLQQGSRCVRLLQQRRGSVPSPAVPQLRSRGLQSRAGLHRQFLLQLPKPGKMTGIRPLGWVADNWQLSGVFRVLTGAPITPGYSLITGITTPTGTPSEGARMEVINPTAPLAQRFGPPPEPAGQASLANAAWLSTEPCAPVRQPGPEHHDRPRHQQHGISRSTATSRSRNAPTVMLRLETYNTFNHTQFSGINSTAQFNTLGRR